MSTAPSFGELFERPIIYPDVDARERLARLVGLDDQIARLTKILSVLINPDGLVSWGKKCIPEPKACLKLF